MANFVGMRRIRNDELPMENANHLRLIDVRSQPPVPLGGAIKRSLDIVIAVMSLMLLAPVMLAVALAVKTQDGGPVFFVQPRIGFGGVTFSFLKFRTMVVDGAAMLERLIETNSEIAREWREKQKLARDPRVTLVGGFLRRTSLDELPQFVNVLLGDMSIVGPRPMLREQIERYGSAYELYCRARPGITGLWQVSGRNDTTFLRRSELDAVYLKEWNVLRDIVLILRTFSVVLYQRGAC